MCIVAEEADESEYWLEVIRDAELSNEMKQLNKLLAEIMEISKIVTKAKSSTYKK